MPDLAEAMIFYVVFLFSTTLHEAAHAWAAKRGGDLTAYHGGQVSLSPIPHIRREPFGMLILPLASSLLTGWPFGYASAPYNREWARQHPRRAARMALAGPAANLALVLFAALLLRVGLAAGVIYAPSSIRFGQIAATHLNGLWPGVTFMVGVIFSLNLLLAIFNLLPVPPLDGSGALPLLLSPGATRRYQDFIWTNPAAGLVGLFVAWKLFGMIFMPMFIGAVNLLYPGSAYGMTLGR